MICMLSYMGYKVRSSLKIRGVYGTFFTLPLAKMRQRFERSRGGNASYADFDGQFGLDTEKIIELYELDLHTKGWQYGTRYQAVRPEHFRQIMESLKINYEGFVFFDLGSGKGRALLLASEYPFKRIIGVELSSQLHEIALENIARYQSPARKCAQIESVCMNAAAYQLPAEDSVVYLHNPFYEEVMVKVLENIRRSLQEHPRKIIIVYHVPVWDGLFTKADFLKQFAKFELPRKDGCPATINEKGSVYMNS